MALKISFLFDWRLYVINNKIVVIKREIIDKETNNIIEAANYAYLDSLIISVIIITLFVPLITIVIIQKSKFKSLD